MLLFFAAFVIKKSKIFLTGYDRFFIKANTKTARSILLLNKTRCFYIIEFKYLFFKQQNFNRQSVFMLFISIPKPVRS